jgi:hypothetical protein
MASRSLTGFRLVIANHIGPERIWAMNVSTIHCTHCFSHGGGGQGSNLEAPALLLVVEVFDEGGPQPQRLSLRMQR